MAYETGKLATVGQLQTALERAKADYTSAIAAVGVSATGTVYTAVKTDLSTADGDVIEAAGIEAVQGDVFVVQTVVDEVDYELSSYIYSGTEWVAITGAVDADKVILHEVFTLAGDYTEIGNLTKDADGTAEYDANGKSISDVLREIFTKVLQPTITASPSISGFALSGAKAVEAGTTLSTASYTAATLNAGSYQYGPDTGVTASNWTVSRVTNSGTTEILSYDGTSLAAGTDDNDGAGFTIGDAGGDGDVSSLKYTLVVTHGAGVTAYDNMGNDSDPAVAITAGTKSKSTSAYTPYRNYFYGATTDAPDLDSDYIRGLKASGKAYASGTISISVPVGAVRIAIACLATKTGVTKVVNETALGADVTDTFTKTTVDVEGANGYTAQTYNVWTYEPAVAYENAATLTVTLG